MLLRELFQILSYGELSNLSISGEGSGEIIESQRDRVTSLVNTALTEISTRKSYKVSYVKLVTSADQATYILLPGADFLVEGNPGDFNDTVLKIASVKRIDDVTTEEVEGYELAVNEENGWSPDRTVRVTGQKTLTFTTPIEGAEYLVKYIAAPAKLTMPHDLDEVVDIPEVLIPAVAYHVSAKVYAGMNGELMAQRARELMAAYNEELTVIEMEDLLADSDTLVFDKLHDRGFV
jgi:hypothetical protein